MTLIPQILRGGVHGDQRGSVIYNNDFDASPIKRMYTLINSETSPSRGWQGHKIEKRWFSVSVGKVEIAIIKVQNWETPDRNAKQILMQLEASNGDVLIVPEGHITKITSLERNTIVLVFSDYRLGEVQDEYKYDLNYFI